MTPASGASVDFNGFDTDEDVAANMEKLDPSKKVELVADANGVVRLPEFKLGAIVLGRSGGRRGQKPPVPRTPSRRRFSSRPPSACS